MLSPSGAATEAGKVALGVLRGDALVNAHYRMGIGVNNAFRTLPRFATLIRSSMKNLGRNQPTKISAAVELLKPWRQAMEGTAQDMVQSQLAIIYFESLCGFLVFADGRVYRRHGDRSLSEMPLDALLHLNCTPEETSRIRAARLR